MQDVGPSKILRISMKMTLVYSIENSQSCYQKHIFMPLQGYTCACWFFHTRHWIVLGAIFIEWMSVNSADLDFNRYKVEKTLGQNSNKGKKGHNKVPKFEKKVWLRYTRKDLGTRYNHSCVRLLSSATYRTSYYWRSLRITTVKTFD